MICANTFKMRYNITEIKQDNPGKNPGLRFRKQK